jgi:hypothetical protein
MWRLPRRCETVRDIRRRHEDWILTDGRFVDCENWRKETKLDETLPTWEYPEKEEVFKWYPQYYHKTDKVFLNHPHTSLETHPGS